MIAVVMAGGHGTRLWPLSRKRTPKQFLALISERAMVVDCVKRLSTAFEPSRIFISCIEEQLPFLQQLLPNVSVQQFLVEPDRRDSGPAMAYVAARWGGRNRERRSVRAFKDGMAPVVVALLVATGWVMTTGLSNGPQAWPLWCLTAASAVLVWRTKIHLLWLLGTGALLGALGWVHR